MNMSPNCWATCGCRIEHGLPINFGAGNLGKIDANRVERAQRRPSAVDIIHAPAAVPTAVGLLRRKQIVQPFFHRFARRGLVSQLAEHRKAARADVRGGRVEQRAVIGERNVVEIIVVIVGVERAPAAIAALQALDPFAPAVDRLIETVRATRVERPRARSIARATTAVSSTSG